MRLPGKPLSGRVIRLALGLGLAVFMFQWLFEVVPVESPPQWSPEARRNAFLIAGRLLERQGARVEFRPVLQGAPAGPGTLVLTRPLATGDSDALRQWIQRGNSLLLPAALPDPLGDAIAPAGNTGLLEGLGARLHDRRQNPLDMKDIRLDHRLLLAPGQGWLEGTFDARLSLRDGQGQALWQLADSNGPHVLRYALGQGHVTVLSESRPFSNNDITAKDNAALWLHLFRALPPGQRVWIVGDGMSSADNSKTGWLTRTMLQGWPLLLSLLLLLLGLVWRGSSRFGPLLPSPVRPRRRLSEHLLAAGRYLWHAGEQARLYQAMRNHARQHLLRLYPHWRTLADEALLAELARASRLPEPLLRQALLAPPTADLARFLQDMRVLNSLRNLTPGNRHD